MTHQYLITNEGFEVFKRIFNNYVVIAKTHEVVYVNVDNPTSEELFALALSLDSKNIIDTATNIYDQ